MRPELKEILEDLPELGSVLDRVVDRYIQLSRVGGTVEVNPRERRSVQRLGCRVDTRGRVSLADLDRVFRKSRLAAPLPVVLEDYRGERLVTRKELEGQEDAAWEDLLGRLRSANPPRWAWGWVEADEASLRAEWRRQEDSWVPELQRALRAARALDTDAPDEALELPRLAYRVTGDAHGLDPDRTAGRLFERVLLHHFRDSGLTLPLSAEDRESLLAMAGLAIDELSSVVHVVGLEGGSPLLCAARQGRHVLALPLRTLYEVGDDLRAHGGVAFAVENRSVLSALHRGLTDVDPRSYPTLVCTGGHLSLAAVRLLDRLQEGGCVIRYSGDFDGRGLQIADALASRLGEAFVPWRMSSDAFERALGASRKGFRIDPGPLSQGAVRRFPDLAADIEANGAAYQEGLTETLSSDIRSWIEKTDDHRRR